MSVKFEPHFTITPQIAQHLLQIEAAKTAVMQLPLTSAVLASLRASARLYSTHYSTMIEGNRLTLEEVNAIIAHEDHFPGKERDEREIKAYYTALSYVEKLAEKRTPITQQFIQQIHALVMADGRAKVKPTAYRDGQNVIREGHTRRIVYLPPQASDVPQLMEALITWINENSTLLPCPLVAALAHYEFATIHPYYDGNGRTARLLTTLILHQGGYDMKGIYAIEEYYAKNLPAYYQAISIGPSHNYYEGRAESDVTPWVDYFIEGMAFSCKKIIAAMQRSAVDNKHDQTILLRTLDPKQRKVLDLFRIYNTLTAVQIGELFGFAPRTSARVCKEWVDTGFLVIADISKKSRRYTLAQQYHSLLA